MRNITLDKKQKERLRSKGLIEITNPNQSRRGISSFSDPVTLSQYLFSPCGFAYRRSQAGLYQLNPRFFLSASYKGRRTKATVKTTDSGAQVELVLRGVRNFRKKQKKMTTFNFTEALNTMKLKFDR